MGLIMKLYIENNRVFINDKEVKGWKKFMVLFFSYLTVPIFITIILFVILILLGVTLTLIIPVCIGVGVVLGVIFIIKSFLI